VRFRTYLKRNCAHYCCSATIANRIARIANHCGGEAFLLASPCRHGGRTISYVEEWLSKCALNAFARQKSTSWRLVSEGKTTTLSVFAFVVSDLNACAFVVTTDSDYHIAPSLLIGRTDHIFTLSSSVGYTAIPAYSQVLLRQYNHLRTIIVIADIDEGFGRSAFVPRSARHSSFSH